MADMTVTKQRVSPLANAILRPYTLGGAASLGDVVYVAADGDVEVADASASATAFGRGIITAIGTEGAQTGAAGDRVSVVLYGPVAGFSGLTPGAPGFTSDTAGKIADAAGTVQWQLGWNESANVFFVNPGLELSEVSEGTAIADLTDSTGLSGTADDTLAATSVPADLTGGESPTETEHNNLLAVTRVIAQNESDLAGKVNSILAALRTAGIIATA